MTFLLYAHPSFIEGIARLYDFGNTLTEYNYSLDPAQADFLALDSDWRTVGQDLRAAVAQLEQERSLSGATSQAT